MSRTLLRALCWAGLALFTAYLLWVNDSYYRANTRTPTYDEAWYLETSLHLYHRLTGGNLGEFLDAYRHAFGSKAPLIAVLPLPFYLLFGASYHSALLVNSLFLIVSNLFLFLLVRRWLSEEAGLAAVVFYQTMPLAYGLSRAFMTEYGLAALVIVFLYYLVASEDLTRWRVDLALGIVLGLGLLMKVMFPAFIAGPLAVVWLRRRTWQPLLWTAAPALILAGPWYAANLQTLLPFAWHSAYGQVAPEYGAGLGQWILLFLNEGLSAYYALALLVFGSLSLGVNRSVIAIHDPRSTVLLSWLLPPLVAIAAGRNHLIRFVAPLLPVFAIALAISIFRLGSRRIAQAALALLLAVYPQRLYAALSYFPHGTGHEHSVRWGPLILFSRDLGWAHPPVFEDPWEQRRVLEALHRFSAGARRTRYVIVGFEHVYLNANLLNYLNAYEEYPLRFTSLGYAESSADKAVERIYSFDARFLILPEGFRDLPPFLNQVNREIEGRIARGELPFRLRAKVALAHQMKALLYEREAPWTSFTPGSPPPQPAYPQLADFPGGIRFLGYDWTRRDGRLWQISCYWMARDHIEQDYRVDFEFHRGEGTVLAQDYYLPALKPAQIVRHDFTVYIPAGEASPLEARVSLIPWGIGPALDPVLRLRLPE